MTSPDQAPDTALATEPVLDEQISEERREAMDAALSLRREGGKRGPSVQVLIDAGIGEKAAEIMIDGFDEMFGILHGVRPDDISPELAAKLDKVEASRSIDQQASQPTKPAGELGKAATAMAARGKSKAEIETYLTDEGLNHTEATQAASKISMDVAAARARFEASKKKAMNSAYWKIGLGVLIVIVALVLMGSGAESSGRRTPLGALIGGGFMLASGVKEMVNVQEQSFEQRASRLLR